MGYTVGCHGVSTKPLRGCVSLGHNATRGRHKLGSLHRPRAVPCRATRAGTAGAAAVAAEELARVQTVVGEDRGQAATVALANGTELPFAVVAVKLTEVHRNFSCVVLAEVVAS